MVGGVRGSSLTLRYVVYFTGHTSQRALSEAGSSSPPAPCRPAASQIDARLELRTAWASGDGTELTDAGHH